MFIFFTVLIFAAKTHCSHISPEAVLMLSLSSSGLLRSTAVDYKVINKLLLSTCSFCVLVLWFLLALFHFYFTSHREIFCWFTAFDLTGRAGCKNVCDHPSFPKYKVKPYRVKYRKHSKAGYGFGWSFNVWVWVFFLNDFPLKTTKIELFFFLRVTTSAPLCEILIWPKMVKISNILHENKDQLINTQVYVLSLLRALTLWLN